VLVLAVIGGCAAQNNGIYLPGPTGLSASSKSTTSFMLSWSDISAAEYYIVYKNGIQYATDVMAASRLISGLTSNTTYRMTVSYVVGSAESSQSDSYYVKTM